MLELMLCSMLTLLPDFLFRRLVQGKRLGREITLFSVWYELRWGITLCLILTVLLITVVLYNHPSSTNVTSLFRTISLFPEVGGRVEKVYVDYNQKVKKGDPLFKMDSTRQEAALERARLPVHVRRRGAVRSIPGTRRTDPGTARCSRRPASHSPDHALRTGHVLRDGDS